MVRPFGRVTDMIILLKAHQDEKHDGKAQGQEWKTLPSGISDNIAP